MQPTVEIPSDIAQTVISPKAYADDTVYAAFRWLRVNNPLGMARLEGFSPFWVVSKHADILEISRQNDLFASGALATTFTSINGDAQVRKLTGGSPHLVRTLVQMTPPITPSTASSPRPGSCPRTSAPSKTAFARSPAPTWITWPLWAGNAISCATSPLPIRCG